MSMQQIPQQKTAGKRKWLWLHHWTMITIISFILIVALIIITILLIFMYKPDLYITLSTIFTEIGVLSVFFRWNYSKADSKINSVSPPVIAPMVPHMVSVPSNNSLPSSSSSSTRRIKLTQDLYSPLFFADMPLPEPSAFFGRARERSLLLDSVSKGGSFSVVGTRRMGKTWLLEYLCQIAPTKLGERVTIGYVDAASSTCTTLTGFIEETLKAFGYYHDVPAHKRSSHLDLALLEQYTHSLREEWRLVILCIDNFDALTRYLKEFDRSFFEAMRAMAQRDLCLVVTSEKPLIRLLKESLHSSPFFNIFSQIKLLPFSETEASEFMRDNGQQAGFTSEEQEDLLKSSQDRTKQWPPLRLQLACKLLLEQKRAHETDPLVEDSVYWHNFNKQLDTQYRQLME